MAGPAFSIVIPTFQRRKSVCDAVRALSAQDYDGAIELIVVVDGSTDGTAEALRKLACPFRLLVVEQTNCGAAAARNRGAAEATGEIILFLDDDMLAQPDLVAQHARMYREGAQSVIGDFPTDGWSPAGFLTDSLVEQAHWERDGGPLTPFDVFTGQLSVRRSIFEELEGFDASFTADGTYGNEDLDSPL
jgi:glycosyltransferase involved in cell wall biosynthesis